MNCVPIQLSEMPCWNGKVKESLHRKIRVRENPYYGIFYAVVAHQLFKIIRELSSKHETNTVEATHPKPQKSKLKQWNWRDILKDRLLLNLKALLNYSVKMFEVNLKQKQA